MQYKKNDAIYDARVLGKKKMFLLGWQHVFAMFGATVIVPIITGLSVSATLLLAGIGTLLFHLITGGKVPAFLGSSFAFIGGYASITQAGASMGLSAEQALPYACVGVFSAGMVYIIFATFFAVYGVKKVMRFFPPIVTGPIIISIGLILSGTAISSCNINWPTALVAIIIIITTSIWGKGMIRIIPILLGVTGSYIFATFMGEVDFTAFRNAAWIGFPVKYEDTVFSLMDEPNWNLLFTSIVVMVPVSIATIIEHIGDMCAISSTVAENFLEKPGLHRTLIGDGIATSFAAIFGGPANTTYGENTGVLNLTQIFDARVVRIAACIAICFSFSPKFASLINTIPTATIGGVSLILYGMISAVGLRNMVENKVNFSSTRNVIIAAVVLVLAIGVKYGANDSINFGVTSLSGLGIAAVTGILLNFILPGRDYEFQENSPEGTAVDFSSAPTTVITGSEEE